MEKITTLKNKGIGLTAVLIATGWSYVDFPYYKLSSEVIRFEINKMRVDTRIDYSIYYDDFWKNYFNDNEPLDNRKLIGFAPKGMEGYPAKRTDYWYDTYCVPFNDSGMHALYIASEIMKFNKIYLIGYDYAKKNGKWHPYNDDDINEDLDKRKTKILQDQIDKYETVNWNLSKIFNCNSESNLKLFSFGMPI